MTTCLTSLFSACVNKSSISRVRAIPEVRAPGQRRSMKPGIARPARGRRDSSHASLRDGRRKQWASGSVNKRWSEERDDSMARKRAMYSAVRLAESMDNGTSRPRGQGGVQFLRDLAAGTVPGRTAAEGALSVSQETWNVRSPTHGSAAVGSATCGTNSAALRYS